MNPLEPSSEPVEFPPPPVVPFSIPSEPFFDYTDLFVFAGLCVPCIFLAVVLVHIVRFITHVPTSVQLLLVQTVWYFLVFGCLAALFRFRYDRPFWQSLAWRPISLAASTGAILAGPILALVVGLLGSALRTPEIDLPFEQMLGSRTAIVLLGLVVVVLGPVAEELAFRGLLMPLLMRSIGTGTGIVLTGIIFGSVHGYEYQWSWRHILLISAAGCVFGWARYKTKSTVASALMHSTFNLTQFAAFLLQARTI
jgi:membrane protease YdiL (CAAX protease family)